MRRLPGGGVLSYFARHRTAANLVFAFLIASGLSAIPQMRAQFFPDVVVDSVSVSVAWPGAGAEDVDAGVVQLLAPALQAVEGVEASAARAREGSASITLDFEPGWDMGRAAEDVQAAVEGVRNLPQGAEAPEVRRGAWRDRVTDVVITGPVGVEGLGRYADDLALRLFAQGVTRTTIQGVAAPEILIEVRAADLVRLDVTMAEIARAVGAEATADPAGEVAGGAARVRTGVPRQTAEAVAGVVVRTRPDGSALRVGEVGRVRALGPDRERAYFVGEDPAVTLRVDRSEAGDAIDIQRRVEAAAAALAQGLPEGVRVDLIRTRAEAITGRIGILLDNAALGLGLVVALLFLFLNARIAFWVAAGIPAALLGALALMWAGGLTINMISLFALIITLGIVVDDAIVVGEHADFRARTLGEPPQIAAERAAARMFAPVLSATATTIIAFWSLVVIGGRFGTLIADIPFTVIAVLLASLVECFLVLPRHMVHALAHTGREHWYDWPSRMVNRGFDRVRDRAFRPLMRLVIAARYPVLAGAVVLLAATAALLVRGDVAWRFFDAPEQGSVTGTFAMLPGASREDSLAMMREMQRAAEVVGARFEAEHGRHPTAYAIGEVGGAASFGRGDDRDPDLQGSIDLELIDADLRPYSSFAFASALQDEIAEHPLAESVSFRGWRSGPGGDGLEVQVFGAEAAALKAAAEALKAELAAFPAVSGLEDTLAYDKDELVLELTPLGQALGFTVEDLGAALRERLGGIEAASFPVGQRSGAIRVEMPREELTADFLDRMRLRAPGAAGEGVGDGAGAATGAARYVPLSDIVSVATRQGFASVLRENGVRVVTVSGDVSSDDPAAAQAVEEALAEDILPRIEGEFGVGSAQEGLAAQERAFLSDALFGFLLCLLAIYLVLAWIFASWTRPAVVMAVIPFGLVGTLYGHWSWDVPLSMFSIVGLIGMTGIIINDSIVLVTTIDEKAEARGLRPAIVEGAADRLRPVLLTTLTTVLGLAPLLFESSVQAQFLKPTVITLVYGLAFGMVLVLIVVPALLAAQADLGRALAAARRALRLGRRAGRRAAPLAWAARAQAAGATLLLALTLGWTIAAGALPGALTLAWPALAAQPPLAAALGLFALGLVLLTAALWAAATLAGAPRARG